MRTNKSIIRGLSGGFGLLLLALVKLLKVGADLLGSAGFDDGGHGAPVFWGAVLDGEFK